MENYKALTRDELLLIVHERDRRIAELEETSKVAIEKAEKYLDRYKNYLESLGFLPVGVFLTDYSGNYVFVNQKWCDLTRISHGEAMHNGWVDSIDSKYREQVLAEWNKCLASKSTFYAQYELVSAEGKHVWVSASANWLSSDSSSPIGFLGTITDISAEMHNRAEMEATYARLKKILSSMQSGVLVEDEHRRIVFTNDAFVKIFSIPVSPDLMIGADCSNSAEESKSAFKNPVGFITRIEELLKNRQAATGDLLYLNDGRVLERDYLPIYINESYRGHLWQYSDVTERKLAEKQLEEYAHGLKASNEGKDKFLSILSHDLKNSFTSIVGFSDFLYEEVESSTTEELKDFAKTINESSRNVFTLLSNLLEWGKIQFGKLQYNPQQIKFTPFVEEIIAVLSASSNQKDVEVQMDIPDGCEVYTDRQMLFSVIQNLINNAIKFSPEGSAIVVRSVTTKGVTAISVTDHGIGMPESTVNNLFRLDKIETREGTNHEKGSGLGLLITGEFIQKMGGKIHIDSEEKVGTTITIELPGQ